MPLVDIELIEGVFDHDQSTFVSELPNRIHVGRMAVQVHRKNGFRSRSDGTLDGSDIHGVCVRVYVHQDRLGTSMGYCQRGSDEAVRGGNDLVAGSDVVGSESQLQS